MTPPTHLTPKLSLLAIAAAIVAAFALNARADQATPQLRFENGRFEPAALDVTAGAPVRLTVVNTGPSAIEFESFELNRERVVPPGRSITVLLPRLNPGQYHFFDDFHHDAGQGTITAR